MCQQEWRDKIFIYFVQVPPSSSQLIPTMKTLIDFPIKLQMNLASLPHRFEVNNEVFGYRQNREFYEQIQWNITAQENVNRE